MNILYISTSFPKIEKGDSIYTDLAEALVEKGHNITVLVAEERKNTKTTFWSNERGCKILRVRVGNIYDVNLVEKGCSLLLMKYKVKFAIKKYLSKMDFSLILYESPPVTNCGVIKYAKKIFNAKTYLMLKDIFPQNAIDIGIMKKDGFIYKFFKKRERDLYNISDKIGCMSEGNRKYLLTHNYYIDKKKVEVFPNTKKIKPINFRKENTNKIREKYNIPLRSTVFLFGGNMGRPQTPMFLCEAIKEFKENENIFFVLVGRGTEREKIKKFLSENNCFNAVQLDNLPRNDYEELVKASDVGIILLDHRFTIPNYPSRILSYMEYAIPVVVATDNNTDFKDLISESECGLWCSSNNLNKFCSNIKILSKDKELRKYMGINGRRCIEEKFYVKKSIDLIEKTIEIF